MMDPEDFAKAELTYGSTLLCPVKEIWQGYRGYCRLMGERPIIRRAFVEWLQSKNGVKFLQLQPWRKPWVRGVGFRQERKAA